MPKAASTARTSSERFGNSSRNKGGTMKKTALAGVFVLLFVFAMTSPSSSQTRGQAPPNMPGAFTFIPKADLEAVMGPTRGDPASESRECQRRGQYGRIHPALSAHQESDAACQLPSQ